MKASVLKRVEELEERLKPVEEELPPVDFGLLIESEAAYFSRKGDFSKWLSVLNVVRRKLGRTVFAEQIVAMYNAIYVVIVVSAFQRVASPKIFVRLRA